VKVSDTSRDWLKTQIDSLLAEVERRAVERCLRVVDEMYDAIEPAATDSRLVRAGILSVRQSLKALLDPERLQE
jgi:hypothetical protein